MFWTADPPYCCHNKSCSFRCSHPCSHGKGCTAAVHGLKPQSLKRIESRRSDNRKEKHKPPESAQALPHTRKKLDQINFHLPSSGSSILRLSFSSIYLASFICTSASPHIILIAVFSACAEPFPVKRIEDKSCEIPAALPDHIYRIINHTDIRPVFPDNQQHCICRSIQISASVDTAVGEQSIMI